MIPVMSRMSSLVRATTSSGMSLGLRFAANSASWRVIPVMMLCSLEGLRFQKLFAALITRIGSMFPASSNLLIS
jgi:hypothetical protein